MATLEEIRAEKERRAQLKAIEGERARRQMFAREQQAEPYSREKILSGVNQRAAEFENTVGGVIEPMMTLASGFAGSTLGNIRGGMEMLNPYRHAAGPGSPEGVAERTTDLLTYQPRTAKGRQAVQAIGEYMQPVGEAIDQYGRWGQEVLDAGGPEWLARIAEGAPEYAMSVLAGMGLRAPKTSPARIKPGERISPKVGKDAEIARALKEGRADPRAALSKLDESRKVVADPLAKAASHQGWNENVIQITKTVAQNPADRIKGLQMVKVTRDGLKDLRYGASTRPDSVMGDSVMARFKVLKKAMLSAGTKLDDVAKKTLNKPVDANRVLARLDAEISKLGGVTDEAGKIKFPAGSRLYNQKANQQNLIAISNQAKALGPTPTGLQLHKFKQWLDDFISEKGMKQAGATGETQRFIGNFRRDINKTLRKSSDEYKKINVQYSETKQAIDELATAFGEKRLYGPNAEEATGGLMRRWISRAPNRVPLMNAMRNAEKVAIKYGGKFDDTIESQVLMANALDDLITNANPLARSTFKADIKATTLTSPRHAMVEKTGQEIANYVERLRGRTDLSALDSIEELLRSPPPAR